MHSEGMPAGASDPGTASEGWRDNTADLAGTPAGANRLPVLAAEIAQAHAACRRSTVDAIKHAVDAGHRLIEAKQLVRHGDWVPWLHAHVPGISVRTAQRYMAAAERAGKNDTASFFRLRDLARPIRERFGSLDTRRVLILTHSTHAGLTHFTVVDTETWEASGFLCPMRDNAIEWTISASYGAAMPAAWSSRKSMPHRENPWLAGAQPTAGPEQVEVINEIIAEADRRLDAMGFTVQREIFPERRNDPACRRLCHGPALHPRAPGNKADHRHRGRRFRDRGLRCGQALRPDGTRDERPRRPCKHSQPCQPDPRAFVVRGELLSGVDPKRCRRLLHPFHEDDGSITPPTFREVPRRWVVIDFDKVPGPYRFDPRDGELAAIYCRTLLPPPWHRASYWWGLSSSAGFKPGVRIKLAFRLDRPALGRELERHLNGCPIDASTLRAVQPIYVARPILMNVADPIRRRTGIEHGSRGTVTLPELPAEAPTSAAATHSIDARRYYVSGNSEAAACRRLEALCKGIVQAKVGDRHHCLMWAAVRGVELDDALPRTAIAAELIAAARRAGLDDDEADLARQIRNRFKIGIFGAEAAA
jgi:hypothetical protein